MEISSNFLNSNRQIWQCRMHVKVLNRGPEIAPDVEVELTGFSLENWISLSIVIIFPRLEKKIELLCSEPNIKYF